jgi:hypothetical protein
VDKLERFLQRWSKYFSFNLEYNYEDKINWDKIKRIIEQTFLTKPLDKMTKTKILLKLRYYHQQNCVIGS